MLIVMIDLFLMLFFQHVMIHFSIFRSEVVRFIKGLAGCWVDVLPCFISSKCLGRLIDAFLNCLLNKVMHHFFIGFQFRRVKHFRVNYYYSCSFRSPTRIRFVVKSLIAQPLRMTSRRSLTCSRRLETNYVQLLKSHWQLRSIQSFVIVPYGNRFVYSVICLKLVSDSLILIEKQSLLLLLGSCLFTFPSFGVS